jgi:hypothetical protein
MLKLNYNSSRQIIFTALIIQRMQTFLLASVESTKQKCLSPQVFGYKSVYEKNEV